MSKTKFYKLSLIAALFSISNITLAEGEENLPSYNLEEDATNLYLKSFFNKREEQLQDEYFAKEEISRERSWDLTPTLLKSRDTRSIIFSNNIVNFEKNLPSDKNTYNKYLLSDCDIYFGKNEDPKFNLISRISRTKTIVGEATLVTMLARPTANIHELSKRQLTIQSLINFKSKDDTLDKILDTYKGVENSILSLFSSRDPFYNLMISQKIQDSFLFSNKSLNTITALGHRKYLVQDLCEIFLKSQRFQYPIWGIYYLLHAFSPYKFCYPPFPPIFGIVRSFESLLYSKYNTSTFVWLLMLTNFGCTLWDIHTVHSNYVENDKILRGIAHRLYDISILLRLSKKLTEVIERNEQLTRVLGDKIVGIKLLLQKIKNDKKLSSIVKLLLNKHEMLRDLHYYTDNAGYILFAYNNLEIIKENIKDAISDIGLIDAYCSCANLFIEHANKENHFVFATYIPRAQSKTPYIKFENLWNPFLDSNVAVPNRIEMGHASATQCTSMIITGPNAGGKSTFVNAVLLAIVMGQTLGIAAGSEILLTPFNKINSYIEVKDDVADGKSAFIAEVDRSSYHYNILKNLKENEFSFSIFDEPFRGTNPMEGSAVEYSIFEKVGGFKNNLSILTTHYPIMTLLEDNNYNLGFRNYKVYIKKDENDRILFTYKIIPGRAKQSIAIDLLYQTGYKNEILKNAREIVRNPKLYETKFEDNKVSQGKW